MSVSETSAVLSTAKSFIVSENRKVKGKWRALQTRVEYATYTDSDGILCVNCELFGFVDDEEAAVSYYSANAKLGKEVDYNYENDWFRKVSIEETILLTILPTREVAEAFDNILPQLLH